MTNNEIAELFYSTYWCTPKEHDAEFVLAMEDVLNVYSIPYNADIPVICMDEKSKQLLDEVYARVDAKPALVGPDKEILKKGKPKRVDSEYERIGTACIFIFTEPLAGWRHVVVRESRKKEDYEFHHTPKHGSWLNIAESELASLSRQCLGDLRIKSVLELNELVSAWECDRNIRQTGVNWQFTTENVRIKLKRLYPTPIFTK